MVKIRGRLAKKFYSMSGNRIVKRRAEKKHECSRCHRIINVGEIEREISGLSDYYNGWYTIYVCGKCWGK